MHTCKCQKPDMTILLSNKVVLKMKGTTKIKERNFKTIKGSITHENKTILNVYLPNKPASKYIKQNVTVLK